MACVVANSIPAKPSPKAAMSQRPNNVKEVVLCNFWTLLDKIRNPKMKRIKKGLQTPKTERLLTTILETSNQKRKEVKIVHQYLKTLNSQQRRRQKLKRLNQQQKKD